MVTLLMTLFIFLCIFIVIFILLQQGKGDMGLGGLGGGGQQLFGGSGGQEFFERTTWVMVAFFVFGSLGLAILKSNVMLRSRIADYSSPTLQHQQPPIPKK